MPVTITKADITDAIAGRNGYSNKQAREIPGSLTGIIKSTPFSGGDVLISGFGKFCVSRNKAPRKGRNPATGQAMTLTARRVVTFKYSGKLRE